MVTNQLARRKNGKANLEISKNQAVGIQRNQRENNAEVKKLSPIKNKINGLKPSFLFLVFTDNEVQKYSISKARILPLVNNFFRL